MSDPKDWKSGKPAKDIDVRSASQILWLPLRFSDDIKDPLQALLDSQKWQPIGQTTAANDEDAKYAEYLYFHPSLRDFIWGDRGGALERWVHKGQAQVHRYCDVLLANGQENPTGKGTEPFVLRMRLERVTLFRCPATPRVCILEIRWDLAADQTPCSLDQWLDFSDSMRRTHMGYFPGEHSALMRVIGGRVPLQARWTNDNEPSKLAWTEGLRASIQQRKNQSLESVRNHRTPLLEHWKALLGEALATASHQIEDERMPYMAMVGVDAPHEISRADWLRLAQADYRGNSFVPPYAAGFADQWEKTHCYDRYFEPGNAERSTRFLQAGYAFTVVGNSNDGFFKYVLGEHFARQYAWIGLLLQYNKAALLDFSYQLSKVNPDDLKKYDEAVLEIQHSFVSFTHKNWFDGFTNQFQGQEISEAWSRQLGLQGLYQTVSNEVSIAAQLAMTRYERRQTLLIEKLTAWGVLVSVLAMLSGAGFPLDAPFALWVGGEQSSPIWPTNKDFLFDGVRLLVVVGWYALVVFLVWKLLVRAIARIGTVAKKGQ